MRCAACNHQLNFHVLDDIVLDLDFWTCSSMGCECPAFIVGNEQDVMAHREMWGHDPIQAFQAYWQRRANL